jgi:hypothetical protein
MLICPFSFSEGVMSRRYVSFDPNAEIIGQNVLGFVGCTNKDRIIPFLEKHGLNHIDPDQWYPLQSWLDVLNDLVNAGGAMFDFVSVGLKIAETAVYPPEVEHMPFADFVMLIPQVYQLQHRNGDVGEERAEKLSNTHLRLIMNTPYPDDLAYGVVWGMARRFLPKGTQFTIAYDGAEPRHDQGGEYTVLDISWG